MTDSRYWPKDVIEQFIALYRSCSALWKVDSKEYRSQYLKNCAYDKLIKFCRERVNSEANKDFVAKRIQGLRGSFRKEAKKAETTGRKPTLWYYELLLFTKEQDENNRICGHQVEETSLDGSDDGKFLLSAEDITEIKQEIQREKIGVSEDTVKKMDTRYWAKDIMVKFIDIYKSFPCLWKISSEEYKNKQLKSQAYENLVAFVQDKIYPEADRDFVIRKIQSLRGVFRKHYNKYKTTKRMAVPEEDVYKPDLWYYDLLLFLKDDEEPGDSYENLTENTIQSTSKNDETQITQVPLDPKTYIETLIKMYKSYPCLWKVGSEGYTNKSVKACAIKNIVTYSKKIHPHADHDFVRKKIQYLRSAFRKEHKKLRFSKENAASNETIYKPSLWYYDLLAFVEEEEEDVDDFEEHKQDGIEFVQQVNDAYDEDIIEIKEEPIIDEEENQELFSTTLSQKGLKRKLQLDEPDFESSVSSGFDMPSSNMDLNEYEAVGVNVSKKLQRMDPTQAIYAESLIVKVLGMGLLRKLNSNTDICEKIKYQ